jgi:hypothetical protein
MHVRPCQVICIVIAKKDAFTASREKDGRAGAGDREVDRCDDDGHDAANDMMMEM